MSLVAQTAFDRSALTAPDIQSVRLQMSAPSPTQHPESRKCHPASSVTTTVLLAQT